MRLSELTRGFGVRIAAIVAAMMLSSMVLLGGAVYTLIDDVLEHDVAERIENEAKYLLAPDTTFDPRAMIAQIENRTQATSSRLFAYALHDAGGRLLSGDSWMRPGKGGWTRQRGPSVQQGGIGGGQVLVLTSRTADGSSLSIGHDIQWIAYVEEELLRLLRWALLGGLALAILTAYLTLRVVSHRIDLVVGSAHAIMDGNLKKRVPLTGANDDFDHLSSTLNEMLDRIQGLIANIEQVTNDIAHDLRTPLGRLRQGLEQARTHATSTDEYAFAVDRAISEADGLLSTFTSMLRIAQAEAGASRSHFREIDLSQALRTVAEAYELTAEETGHSLATRIADGVTLMGERDLVVQAFANLLENALTHTPSGSALTVSLESQPGAIVARVADNGPGVPAEERERIFQRFYRLEQSRTSPGTGLGLSLVAAVAKLHGARIEVGDNKPGLFITLTFPTGGATH